MAQYQRPETLQAALTQLGDDPDETVVSAGGTTIVPFLRDDEDDTVLLDIGGISELKQMSAGAEVKIGSTVTLAEFLAFAIAHAEVQVIRALGDVASHIADPVMRNQATVGGNVARGGELVSMLLALDAEVIMESEDRGTRRIRLRDRLAEEGAAALGRPNELLTAIAVRDQPYAYVYYDKFTRSHLASVPLASIAVAQIDDGREVRVVLGSHRLFPERMETLEESILAQHLTLPSNNAARLVQGAMSRLSPAGDPFQTHIIQVLVERALGGGHASVQSSEVSRI